jgi:hypothetical protein
MIPPRLTAAAARLEAVMTHHKFAVGQTVNLLPKSRDAGFAVPRALPL